ncbi:universal stress protein [Streptomyces sp. VRA16 Mangrove soil]|uniref:universal stress protein n=1 Tax=Streptomyces sp. VRA16 Mangrove soil TaxID=2817434 RepID=UPI001A9ED8C5|nr:universal stress protein [Streptomyces sp. VRA16 Mangrove soil]MBO1331272.1 universal stress protein [Streptomyces sp. VRA16 Mangrove soil]
MYDDGPRAGRVVVGVNGSPASLAALRSAVDQARRTHRPLVAAIAWQPPEGEGLYSRWPDRQWARHWYGEARATLTGAFEAALGGLPSDVDATLRVVRGKPGPVLVGLTSGPDDLLVVGGHRGAVHRHVRRHSLCPVLTVPVRKVNKAELRALLRMTTAA